MQAGKQTDRQKYRMASGQISRQTDTDKKAGRQKNTTEGERETQREREREREWWWWRGEGVR